MVTKSLRGMGVFLVATGLLSWSYFPTNSKAATSTHELNGWVLTPADVIGPMYTQPVDPAGKIVISSWRDPDGSDFDRYVWDSFILPATEPVTGFAWVGGFDPTRFGSGGPVIDFSVEIYPSIPAGTEPAIANPPLVQYMTGGNAGQTSIGTVGGIPMYRYTFNLPAPFAASVGVKYWVQIEATQQGSLVDWGLAKGTGGNSNHYVRMSGAGGDILYRSVPDDVAFSVLGLIPDTPTDISISNDRVNEHQPANTIVGALTATDPDPAATFTFSLACAAAGADDGSFNILTTNLRTSEVFNFETKPTYHICIRVKDQNALTYDESFTISVNGLYYLPVIVRHVVIR